MSQKESEWEKEFEKVMGCIPECASGLYEDVGCPAHGYDAMKSVKFFRGVLSNREKEIAEKVEKMKVKTDDLQPFSEELVGAYSTNATVEEVLKILKHNQ